MAYYARKCDAEGNDLCGGDNCLWLDGRYSFRTMRSRAAEYARAGKAAGFNIYRSLRDTKPIQQVIFIRTSGGDYAYPDDSR